MRNYQFVDLYLDQLESDIYPQPSDPGHTHAIEEITRLWLPNIDPVKLTSILDVGCAQGQALPYLRRYASRVEGITLGSADAESATEAGHTVEVADMMFLPYEDNEFDLIFARHVLEHSPAPLLALMEWQRVAKHYLMVIVPDYRHYGSHGDNHYYVLLPDQWQHLFDRAGWEVVWEDKSCLLKAPFEWRWLCQKKGRDDDGLIKQQMD